jgi:hypothetical protein
VVKSNEVSQVSDALYMSRLRKAGDAITPKLKTILAVDSMAASDLCTRMVGHNAKKTSDSL